MSKDPHLKRQKQIRMSDEVRERFDRAQKKSKLIGEDFVVAMLDAYEGKSDLTQREVLDWIERNT